MIITASTVLLSAAGAIGGCFSVVNHMPYGLDVPQCGENDSQVFISHVAIPVPRHRSAENAGTHFAGAQNPDKHGRIVVADAARIAGDVRRKNRPARTPNWISG